MTPADIVVRWPSAEEIARAAFAAAKAEGCDAIEMLNGAGASCGGTSVARLYAVIALAQQYPTAPRADLSRKLGCKAAARDARTYLRQGKWRTFCLDKLNAVRASCGWGPMTREEALVAPLTLCGRPWTEFVDRADAEPCAAAEPQPEAGDGREQSPALNQTPTKEDETEPVARVCTLSGDDLGGSSSEKGVGADADVVGLASAKFQSSDGRAEGRALEGPTGDLREVSRGRRGKVGPRGATRR